MTSILVFHTLLVLTQVLLLLISLILVVFKVSKDS